MRTHRCVAGLAAGLLLAAGCGPRGVHPVKGRVTFPDGRPLTAGRVAIDTGNAFTGSWGAVRADGTFVMGTNAPDDGVPAGTFRVYLVGAVEQPSNPDEPLTNPKPLVHERFTRPEASGLTFTVPDQTTWEITVEPPAKPKGR